MAADCQELLLFQLIRIRLVVARNASRIVRLESLSPAFSFSDLIESMISQ
jgi:hypothetical protein